MAGQIDEIKARVDIVDLIGEYIRLKQIGTNWRGLCPFHNEKTPSFMVSRDKQIWHCFGCSEGGDIFSFLQKIEGLEFAEALKTLAQRAGVKLVASDPQLVSEKNRLIDICRLAAAFWHKILLESPSAQGARDYLKKRQLIDNTISDFQLGYAPESWDVTLKFLLNKGFKETEIFLAGLTVKKERGEGFYDRFRQRITFPIRDPHGQVVGFSARALQTTESAKYINTPQTLIYNKSLILYNLDKAKTEIKKSNLAILVEGQMDVISAWQAGSHNVIAASGTALTLDQIKILKRYTNTIALSFDADAAGQNAAKRGVDIALSQDMEIKVIVLPFGKDPDECIKQDPSAWFKAIAEAPIFMDYFLAQTVKNFGVATAEGKKQIAKTLLPLIARMGNRIEQTHWLQRLAELLKVSEQILREAISTASGLTKQRTVGARIILSGDKNKQANQVVIKDRAEQSSEQILAILLKYPRHLPHVIDALPVETLVESKLLALYKELIIYYTKTINSSIEAFAYADFKTKIKDSGLAGVADTLILLAEKDFFDFDYDNLRLELSTLIDFLKKNYYESCARTLSDQIKAAEAAGDKLQIAKLVEQFSQIMEQLKTLNN